MKSRSRTEPTRFTGQARSTRWRLRPPFRRRARASGRRWSSRWRATKSLWTSMSNESRRSIREVTTCRHKNSGMSRNASRNGLRRGTSGSKITTPVMWCGSRKSACGGCLRLARSDGHRATTPIQQLPKYYSTARSRNYSPEPAAEFVRQDFPDASSGQVRPPATLGL